MSCFHDWVALRSVNIYWRCCCLVTAICALSPIQEYRGNCFHVSQDKHRRSRGITLAKLSAVFKNVLMSPELCGRFIWPNFCLGRHWLKSWTLRKLAFLWGIIDHISHHITSHHIHITFRIAVRHSEGYIVEELFFSKTGVTIFTEWIALPDIALLWSHSQILDLFTPSQQYTSGSANDI